MIIPPRGAVTALLVVFCGLGIPMYWTVVVFVVAVMSVWALALKVANAIRRMKQNQTLCPFTRETGVCMGALKPGEVTCAHTAPGAVVRVEDLIFVPSRPEASASGSISTNNN
jgi:hypothetical protein